jgi:hypothetical protein
MNRQFSLGILIPLTLSFSCGGENDTADELTFHDGSFQKLNKEIMEQEIERKKFTRFGKLGKDSYRVNTGRFVKYRA